MEIPGRRWSCDRATAVLHALQRVPVSSKKATSLSRIRSVACLVSSCTSMFITVGRVVAYRRHLLRTQWLINHIQGGKQRQTLRDPPRDSRSCEHDRETDECLHSTVNPVIMPYQRVRSDGGLVQGREKLCNEQADRAVISID